MTIQRVWNKVPLTCFHWDPINILENIFGEIFFIEQKSISEIRDFTAWACFLTIVELFTFDFESIFCIMQKLCHLQETFIGTVGNFSPYRFWDSDRFLTFFWHCLMVAEWYFIKNSPFWSVSTRHVLLCPGYERKTTLWIATHLVTTVGNIPYKLWHFWMG